MSYSSQITTLNRQAIVFLIDQSGSMSETIEWKKIQTTKAAAVAEVINQAIYELLIRCKDLTEYKPYFDIALFGYSGYGVKSLINTEKTFVSPAELAATYIDQKEITNIRTKPDGKKITTNTIQKIWIKPVSEGRTPMVAAFTKTYEILSSWIANKTERKCVPPLVINITDGEATDGDTETLSEITEQLKNLKTLDGQTLLLNIHISNHTQSPIIFPNDTKCPIENTKASMLFNISSTMPEFFNKEIAFISSDLKPYKAFAYNASIADLVRIINVGSSGTLIA